MGADHH